MWVVVVMVVDGNSCGGGGTKFQNYEYRSENKFTQRAILQLRNPHKL
jgi:hypothetical protein